MKTTTIAIFVFLFLSFGFGLTGQVHAPSMAELLERYPEYKELEIEQKRFTISDVEPILQQHSESPEIDFQIQGFSLENRPIYLGTFGQGETRVLLWSQMHGDESTATMALLDLFNFLTDPHPEDQSFVSALKTRLTLYFIPMLNPDGAEEFERRNAASIDLNRDALNLSSPESRILKSVRDSLEPVFGFNLHDQSIYYRAGRDGEQVAMAFLAPAYDFDKSVNDVRLRSMQLIAHLNDSLQTLIPNRIATYDDSFEPRAFGDNIQKWGTSTILVESGGYPDDPEKQFLRKLNFVTLIKTFESIMMRSYETKSIGDYENIPANERRMLSLIIEDLLIPMGDYQHRMDVGYIANEVVENGIVYYPAQIVDVGDLSTFSGLTEISGSDLEVIQGEWYPQRLANLDELSSANWEVWIKQGYLGFEINQIPDTPGLPFSNIILKQPGEYSNRLTLRFSPGYNPTFILQSHDNNDRWIVHNGTVYTEREYIELVRNELEKQSAK